MVNHGWLPSFLSLSLVRAMLLGKFAKRITWPKSKDHISSELIDEDFGLKNGVITQANCFVRERRKKKQFNIF